MAFLENLGKKVGEAAQAAARKSGELVEITKLNVNIGSEEDKIQKLYTQIGKSIFEKYSATGVADQDVQGNCEAIKVHEQNIKTLKEKVMEVKNVKSCMNCGTEMDRSQVFCSKCGTRNEVAAAAPQPEQQPAAPAPCVPCGAALTEGAVFCTNCGTKVG